MKGGELRSLVPHVVVTLLLLTSQPAEAAFTARTGTTATFRAAESFGARNIVAPSIAGTAVAGQTLTASAGLWKPADAHVSLRWELETAGVFQLVGSGPTYTLPATSAGKRIRVVATSGSVSATSVPVLVAAPVAPANTGLPGIEGAVVVGSTLTGTTGAWANLPTTYTREWLRCAPSGGSCSVVAGRIAASYTLATSDVGYALRHRVTARNAAGASTATSAPAAPLAPRATTTPSLSGLAFTGPELGLSPTIWAWNTALGRIDGTTWWRCPDASGAGCTQIPATSSIYAPVAADVGHHIRARATLTQNGVVGEASAPQTIGPIVALPPRLNASVTTNVPNTSAPATAADGSRSTVFTSTSPQRTGQWVRLDFGAVRTLVAYEVTGELLAGVCEVSSDGLAWSPIEQDPESTKNGPGTAFTPPIRARFLRLRIDHDSPHQWWLHDIRVWGS